MLNKQNKRKSFVERIKNFIEIRKIRKEEIYKGKIEFLESECYKFYLAKILDERYKAKVIDFPRFMYEMRLAICSEAVQLSKRAVAITEQKYGRKFIEKCYKLQFQKTNKISKK